MKKQFLGVAALASLMSMGTGLSAGKTVNTSIQKDTGTSSPEKQALPSPADQIMINEYRRIKDELPPIAGLYYGVSPKEWGMYLQRTGRQKWIKKSPKKPR